MFHLKSDVLPLTDLFQSYPDDSNFSYGTILFASYSTLSST